MMKHIFVEIVFMSFLPQRMRVGDFHMLIRKGIMVKGKMSWSQFELNAHFQLIVSITIQAIEASEMFSKWLFT